MAKRASEGNAKSEKEYAEYRRKREAYKAAEKAEPKRIKHKVKAERVHKFRHRGKQVNGKFIPKIEEVSSTQFKAPKPP